MTTGAAETRRMLLPRTGAPAIAHARGRNADNVDVLLNLVTLPVDAAAFDGLPQPARWRELHGRASAKSGSVRSLDLGNRRHTLAVIGYLRKDASAFERLSLAGRMLKEAAGR
ncbi:MAG TPA: hypothetical protein VL994_13135, partial [Steroidobacteraceae bacterium]|nr:hypothetical protein [Steroidobacteraceae bacterium]